MTSREKNRVLKSETLNLFQNNRVNYLSLLFCHFFVTVQIQCPFLYPLFHLLISLLPVICLKLLVTRTPDSSNFSRFPLKVRVIRSRLYMVNHRAPKCVCLNIIKIKSNFRSLFYHDSTIKTFCSREQSSSHVHAYTFLEFEIFVASSSESTLYFLVSLFGCFDHFIGVFDYSVGRSIGRCCGILLTPLRWFKQIKRTVSFYVTTRFNAIQQSTAMYNSHIFNVRN